MKKMLRVWRRMAQMSLRVQLSYPLGSLGFLIGKLVRFIFFFAFLAAAFRKTRTLSGYTLPTLALFFLTYNWVDMIAQTFFRGIYSARRAVEEGDFDFYLVQPCPPLFRLCLNTVDFLDIASLLPVAALTAWVFPRLGIALSLEKIMIYALLTLNGVAIAFAIHVFVAALAVRTQELENAIWVYRDVMFLGKFPTSIYGGPLQIFLTWVIPVGVMVSFPAQALLGSLTASRAGYALLLAAALLAAARLSWSSAVKSYSSSSS